MIASPTDADSSEEPKGMTIANLPTELIFEVAKYVGGQDASQIRLAVTCRRFYEALMPQILQGQLTHLQTLILSTRLSLHTDTNTPKAFGACLGPFGESYLRIAYEVRDNEKDNRCVHSLIARAKRVDTVFLHMQKPYSLKKLASILNACAGHPNLGVSITGCGGRDEDSGRGPFAFSFHKLHPHLYVENIGVKTAGNEPRRSVFSPLVWQYFSKQGKKEGSPSAPDSEPSSLTYAVIDRPPKYPLSLVSEPQLTSISIDTDTLFLATMYPFTLDLLNLSPITRLSLSHITLSVFDWSLILPSIHMKSLTHLAIADLQIPFPDLLQFFQRHPSITTLDMTNNLPIGIVKFPLESVLPLLSTVTGSSGYLVPLLQHQILGYLPSLRRLCLSRDSSDIHVSQIHVIRELIAQGTHGPHLITFEHSN